MKCDEERLEQIEARVTGAKTGPWFAHPTDREPSDGERARCDGIRTSRKRFGGVDVVVTDSGVYPPDLPTAEFIAHARTDVPDLVDDLREARREHGLAAEGARKSAAEFLRADAALLRAQQEIADLKKSAADRDREQVETLRGAPGALVWMLNSLKHREEEARADAVRLRRAYRSSAYASACELLARLEDEAAERCRALVERLSAGEVEPQCACPPGYQAKGWRNFPGCPIHTEANRVRSPGSRP